MSDYRPREHDHLVEPVFGGLGVESPRTPAPRPGFLRRLWRALVRLVRPSRRASGR
jgi:hypothetical protein